MYFHVCLVNQTININIQFLYHIEYMNAAELKWNFGTP